MEVLKRKCLHIRKPNDLRVLNTESSLRTEKQVRQRCVRNRISHKVGHSGGGGGDRSLNSTVSNYFTSRVLLTYNNVLLRMRCRVSRTLKQNSVHDRRGIKGLLSTGLFFTLHHSVFENEITIKLFVSSIVPSAMYPWHLLRFKKCCILVFCLLLLLSFCVKAHWG